VRLRIAILVALLVTVAALLSGLVARALLVQAVGEQRRIAARQHVGALLARHRPDTTPSLHRLLDPAGGVAHLSLYAPDGALVATAGPPDAPGLEVRVAWGEGGRGHAVARFAPDVPPRVDPADAARLALFYALLNAAVIALASLALLSRHVVRPVDVLLRQLDRGGATDLAAAAGGLDPLGRLGASLRQLLKRLGDREAALKDKVAALERTQAELVQAAKLAAVGRMAAGVAHEIGNPLAAVQGLAGLLADAQLAPAERAELAQRIEAELRRVDAAVRSLLDYARQRPPAIGHVDVNAVATDAVALLRLHGRRAHAAAEMVAAPDLPVARADAERLRQIVVNLLLNAADAVRARADGRIRVRTSTDATRARVTVEVADNGPGVPEDARGAIFDPFVTSKPPGQGTGLGLAISLDLAESMGAELCLASPDPDLGGACFALVLPAAVDVGRSGE
jgi:C4-dicarboxylate-specific signal transduction histidine kinase